jgi:hypothetical protein
MGVAGFMDLNGNFEYEYEYARWDVLQNTGKWIESYPVQRSVSLRWLKTAFL